MKHGVGDFKVGDKVEINRYMECCLPPDSEVGGRIVLRKGVVSYVREELRALVLRENSWNDKPQWTKNEKYTSKKAGDEVKTLLSYEERQNIYRTDKVIEVREFIEILIDFEPEFNPPNKEPVGVWFGDRNELHDLDTVEIAHEWRKI